ncbi:MAG: hypothetical protein KA354_03470 [Phycisphaerae bacterium]|nr:hypothetical protein [Phycisphaerae bacterium]
MAIDVLGLGCAAVDDLLYLPYYPPADAKMAVSRRDRQCGGLTATAMVAAARMGSSCAYAAALGDDDLSRFVIERLQRAGVDTRYVVHRAAARPYHSIILVDESTGTRNIFFDNTGVVGADASGPAEDVIRSARVLFTDHVGIAGSIRGAKLARVYGIPVVADLERDDSPRFAELLALVNHPIVSHDFAARITGERDPAAAVCKLWQSGCDTAIVTCGAAGCWYLAKGESEPQHQPAFKVEVVDTTGCGDVFHGGYASALARGMERAERVRFASAVAALKAMQPGGQVGIPTRAVVEEFLKRYDAGPGDRG